MARWQAALPGVGSLYQVSLDMLRGVAVPVVINQEPYLKYFAVQDVPSDADAGFAALFDIKEKWTSEELAPYMEVWSSDSNSQSSLLLQYTKVVTEEDGNPVKIYVALS